ncbi:MAG: gephyrin-like molybdotransferase Glp [Syntrophomonadaceae bacterium]|jgi:molybdopterin molybdotransferase
MGEFLKVLTFQNARNQIIEHFPGSQSETVALVDAYGRILSDPVTSPEELPAFSRTTVDGYAVAAEDTFGSSESLPGFLDQVGEVEMGKPPQVAIGKGQCCWIPTGGMLPDGANAAVMVEYTEKLGDNTVLVYRPVAPLENIMQKGEDVALGQHLFPAGKRVRPQDIGLMASLGISTVGVFKPYKIGIISTGDEIIAIQSVPGPGQIRDVNSHSLAAAVLSCGAIPHQYPVVKDSFDKLKQAVNQALQENDAVLISGGSSVGVADYTLDVLLSFPDSELLFHGIAVKPGKPTMAVRIGDKMVIGLPGHPVSALMVFYIICAPVLRFTPAQAIDARVTMNIASQAGRDDFIPVRLIDAQGGQKAQPLLGKSGLMSILALADGYIHIPYEKQGIEAGETIRVIMF